MRSRAVKGLVGAVVAVSLTAAGCGGSGNASAGSSTTTNSSPTTAALSPTTATAPASTITAAGPPANPPAGLPAWYAVPAAALKHPGAPGTVIKTENLGTEPGIHATVYRVMYASKTALGEPSVVTGLIYVPLVKAPAGGHPVISWAHGTNGMAPTCALSLTPDAPDGSIDPSLNTLLDKGWEVVASDYQGEGTTGPLPYLVGNVSAYNTVDIVRAAHNLPAAHAATTYAVWGHSEGGQTAVFADELGPSYAPDLHLVGVVAGAPPSQFNLIYQFLTTSPFRFYLIMAVVGFNTAYGDQQAPLSQVLSPLGQSVTPVLNTGCFEQVERAIDRYSLGALTTGNPFNDPAWRKLLNDNDPQQIAKVSDVPLLIAQGSADEQIPVVTTQLVAKHLCALGQSVQRWIYPGDSHTGVIEYYVPDMVKWLSARFANQSVAGITPHGQAGATASACNT